MARIWNKHKQTNTPLKRKVFVAMSGGVDSSVAAVLLKREGFNIVGVFMKPWQPSSQGRTLAGSQGSTISYCLWKEDREDALRAAAVLDIPLLTWDFSKEYKKYVTDYIIREYKAGRTPNPDVMCNKEIKFGLFFKKAMREGADYIATGHYAKIKNGKLYVANDKNKDQTYFLWTLTQKHLAKTLFPIGDYIKPEVRKMAKKFGLPNHDKKDSQGVCFIGPLDMKSFLKNYIKTKPGKILDLNGQELGRHDGIYYYTIGQRHGLNLGIGGGPYYVIAKDIKKNIIYIGTEKDLAGKTAKVSQINWIDETPKFPAELFVRTRYRAPLKKAILKKNGELIFKQPERAITSGQSAVFYLPAQAGKGTELLGGGIIE